MSAKKQVILKAVKRSQDENLDDLRKSGWIPVILYGHGFKNVSLQVKHAEFAKVFAEAGESTLIDLQTDEISDTKVLIKEVQQDPIKDNIIHIDLYKINMKEYLNTEIPLNFIGEAPAVKDLGGILVKNLDKVEVKCLPGDLVHDISVDISKLNEINSSISVRDLSAPDGIEFLTAGEVQIVSIAEPRKVEEETPAEEVSEADAVGAVGKVGDDKKDDESSEAKSESKDASAEKEKQE